ncbi:MAG: hypothetical protein F6K24_08580 [Okeania sp. SIO2D1]|nr:hypothetical protein [Okeania sp. SIO2D1]
MAETTQSRMYAKNEVLEKFGIKNNAYYDRLKFLGIKPERTKEGSFLSSDQLRLMEELHQHIQRTGKMEGFDSSSFRKRNNTEASEGGSDIVHSGSKEITTDEDDNLEVLEPEENNFNPDLQQLIREAAELKASDLAMADLVKRAIASKMSIEDLPEDLRAKVAMAKEAATPKSNPAQVNSLAESLLAKYRSQGGN